MQHQEQNDVEKQIKEELVEEEAIISIRPTLIERSSSFFDIPKDGARPVARRWRSMMDRNAMANPGASHYVPKD